MTKFPVRILIRPLLNPGMLAFEDQSTLFTSSLVILIASNQPADQKVISLWHEALHLLLRAGGKEEPHDENWVEERAKALALACPDIFEKMR